MYPLLRGALMLRPDVHCSAVFLAIVSILCSRSDYAFIDSLALFGRGRNNGPTMKRATMGPSLEQLPYSDATAIESSSFASAISHLSYTVCTRVSSFQNRFKVDASFCPPPSRLSRARYTLIHVHLFEVEAIGRATVPGGLELSRLPLPMAVLAHAVIFHGRGGIGCAMQFPTIHRHHYLCRAE